MSKPIDISNIVVKDAVAHTIVNHYVTWEQARDVWLRDQAEKLKYIYATSTHNTEVGASTPWKNNTTIPKLTQIRDNLHANYMSALFPNSKWLEWRGADSASNTQLKRTTILSYMRNQLEQSKFRTVVSQLVLDWIDYGNCFAMPVFEANVVNTGDGVATAGYTGAKLIRVSPYDIVFNPLATDFENSPKIIRSVKTLGELRKDILTRPEMGYLEEVFQTAMSTRRAVQMALANDHIKSEQMVQDGFGGIDRYYESEQVELLDFYGDIYNVDSDTLEVNRLVTVIDRSFVIRNVPNPSWNGQAPVFHCGWRMRPDSLWAMSPLDNLVGMQYMVDKLQNSKADVIDQIIHPFIKIKGQVDDFEFKPQGRVQCYDDGDVELLRPDMTVFNVNNEIAMLQNQMEEMAGAPRQAMGLRTPGEKTKFEVQVLENGSQRIFLNKTAYFEEVFLEPIVNCMLEFNIRLAPETVVLQMESPEFSTTVFRSVNKEDLNANGFLKPIGARHIAEKANQLQDLIQICGFTMNNQSTAPHVSGKEIAKLVFSLAGYESNKIVKDNVAITEAAETASVQQSAQAVVAETEAVGAPDPLTDDELANEEL